MKKTNAVKKLSAIVLACTLAFSAAGCGSSGNTNMSNNTTSQKVINAKNPEELVAASNTIHLSVLGVESTNPRKPVKDVLTPIWREKTKVIPDIVTIPTGQDVNAWLQNQIVANTVPDIIANPTGIADNPLNVDKLKKAGMCKEITLDEMKKYMPRTAARLEELGMTIDEWYAASVDPADGKLWVIPSLPSPLLNAANRAVTSYSSLRLGNGGYSVWVRDDILKMIYPNAMTSDELKTKAIANGGSLPLSEIDDVPINNIDDLHSFLKKIKNLNLKQNGQDIIPAHLQFDNTSGALSWSLFSITGLFMTSASPWEYVYDTTTNTGTNFQFTPEWKNYMTFMNQGFSEGLFGKEFYTQKDDQRQAKIISGQYAVINMWAPYQANIDQQIKNGGQKYGWRLIPIFPASPINYKDQDALNQYFDLKTSWNSKIINAKKVTDDMMPQVLNWIDWNYSTEAAIDRAWGSPDMSTGTGMDRRFKPEYQKIADYMLTGKADETGDGWYYGIQNNIDQTMQNYEVYGLAGADEMGYVYSPKVVYPFSPKNYDQYSMVNAAWQQETLKHMKLYARLPLSKDGIAAQAKYNELATAASKVESGYSTRVNEMLIKALSAPASAFEKDYAAYIALLNSPDVVKADNAAWDAYEQFHSFQQKALKPLN